MKAFVFQLLESTVLSSLQAIDFKLTQHARPYIAARGEHDFVTEAAVQRWKAALPCVTPLVARGGSHLPFLEAHAAAPYLRAVAGFVASCEEQEAEQRRGEEQIEKKILDV